MKKSPTFKVPCNLIQAQVYARNPELVKDMNTSYTDKTYPVLREHTLPNGSIYAIEQEKYPVTPESVKSYAASADYRRDIATAVNTPARGKNLGDLSSVQEILSSDLEKCRNLYGSLKAVFETAQTQTAEKQAAQDQQKEGEK